jgi:hypothetical protein
MTVGCSVCTDNSVNLIGCPEECPSMLFDERINKFVSKCRLTEDCERGYYVNGIGCRKCSNLFGDKCV